jgi:hypothetical protein
MASQLHDERKITHQKVGLSIQAKRKYSKNSLHNLAWRVKTSSLLYDPRLKSTKERKEARFSINSNNWVALHCDGICDSLIAPHKTNDIN